MFVYVQYERHTLLIYSPYFSMKSSRKPDAADYENTNQNIRICVCVVTLLNTQIMFHLSFVNAIAFSVYTKFNTLFHHSSSHKRKCSALSKCYFTFCRQIIFKRIHILKRLQSVPFKTQPSTGTVSASFGDSNITKQRIVFSFCLVGKAYRTAL